MAKSNVSKIFQRKTVFGDVNAWAKGARRGFLFGDAGERPFVNALFVETVFPSMMGVFVNHFCGFS